ncbi:hypothetical protein J2X28_001460 [Kocuria rhizophila]|nr:hypothetical protein [Kocuria rhizophila]
MAHRRVYALNRLGRLWHREHRYEERLEDCSRTIMPSSPPAAHRGQGSPARPYLLREREKYPDCTPLRRLCISESGRQPTRH